MLLRDKRLNDERYLLCVESQRLHLACCLIYVLDILRDIGPKNVCDGG